MLFDHHAASSALTRQQVHELLAGLDRQPFAAREDHHPFVIIMGDESQQLLDPSHFLCYREFSPNVIVVPPSIDRSPIVAAPTIRATATTPLRHCMLIINHAVPAMHCSVAAASHSRRLCHSCHGHVSPTLRIQWESPTPFTCRICLKYATLRWGICSNQLRNKNVLL